MSSPDQRAPAGGAPAQMRVRLKYTDVQSFIEKFAPNVSRQGIFIASRNPRPVGTSVRFELMLADGTSRLLRGEGVVTWVREFDADNPGRPHGMGVKFSRLDAESRRIIERIEAFKQERGMKEPAREGAEASMATESAVPVASGSPIAADVTDPTPAAEAIPEPTPAAADASEPTVVAPAFEPVAPPEPRRSALELVRERLAAAGAGESSGDDLLAQLDTDGEAVERSLTRAREIARSLAAEGLDELMPGGVSEWLQAARADAGRLAQEMVPRRAPPILVEARAVTPREPEPDSPEPPAPRREPEPEAPPQREPIPEEPQRDPQPAPPPPVEEPPPRAPPEPDVPPQPEPPRVVEPARDVADALARLVNQPPMPSAVDDRTIVDYDINFDLDAIERRIADEAATPPAEAPPPPPSASRPLPPVPPRPPSASQPLSPVSSPPPPPPPRARAVPPPPPPPRVEVELDDATIEAELVPDESGPTQAAADAAKNEKKGFFSKLFKK